MTGVDFTPDANKFHALTSKDEIVFAHGALKALAADMMKMARMIEMFEDNDDVQNIWHNWENEDEYEG